MIRTHFFKESLYFEIYVVGYRSQGESIVLLARCDGNCVFAGLVDCYESHSINKAIELLVREGKTDFDFVCWTHPHKDHTIGLNDIITNYCDKNTSFWMPPFTSSDETRYKKDAKDVYETLFSTIKDLKRNRGMHIRTVTNNGILLKESFQKLNETDYYYFEILSFAPDSELLAYNRVIGIETMDNLYSVGLIIHIGGFYILLAGDVENNTFKNIPDHSIDYPIQYIKIPHHSSPTGEELVTRLLEVGSTEIKVATTTVYRNHSLPKREVLEKYRRSFPEVAIYSTGNVEYSDLDEHEYGIVKTSFDILQLRKFDIETELFGNAVPVITETDLRNDIKIPKDCLQ